jgi:hypothetical protein
MMCMRLIERGTVLGAVMICTAIAPLYAQPVQETGKILMLYAYDPNTPGVAAFAQQLKMVVNEQFHNRVEIYDEYLDLNRFPGLDRSPQLAHYFAEKYQGFGPDAIVAAGTPALRFATERLSGLFPGVPIVYGQAFEPVVDFSALPANVTGRRQPLPFVSTYSLARALQPDAERVVVVGGASQMDSLLLSVALREITPLLHGMELDVLQDWSYESLIDSLHGIPPRTFVIFSSFSRDQRGRKFIPGDLIASLARLTSAPAYGIARNWVGDGIVGGGVMQFADDGMRTGRLLVRVLRRHALVRIRRRDPADQLALAWITGHDRALLGIFRDLGVGVLCEIQSQAGFASRGCKAVTAETVLRKDRPDVPVVVDGGRQ